MKQFLVLLTLALLLANFGCAETFPQNGGYPRQPSKFDNFYERHLGDSLFVDALSGFTPTIILGIAADAVEKKSSQKPDCSE